MPGHTTRTGTMTTGPVRISTTAASMAITFITAACAASSESGAAARQFRYEVDAGNVGINVGVPAPVAWFPFSGAKGSFFGVLHPQGRDAVRFFTETKVVISRWGGTART